MSERWVAIGWDDSRHNSAQRMHTGDESACRKMASDFMRETPRGWEVVAMTELEWRRLLDADTRGD